MLPFFTMKAEHQNLLTYSQPQASQEPIQYTITRPHYLNLDLLVFKILSYYCTEAIEELAFLGAALMHSHMHSHLRHLTRGPENFKIEMG